MKTRGKRNISKYNRSVIKVNGKSIEVKGDNFSYLNRLKGRLQIENDKQSICYDDVIGYLINSEKEKRK